MLWKWLGKEICQEDSKRCAFADVVYRANKMDSTVPWILTIISAPIMAAKQYVNVEQLVVASKWLAEGDIAERRKKGLPRKEAKKTQ